MRRVHWAATEVLVNINLAKLMIFLLVKYLIFLCAAIPMGLMMQEERTRAMAPTCDLRFTSISVLY